MSKGKRTTTSAQNRERFVQAAREAGCDESPEAFEGKLRKITAAKPIKNASLKKGNKGKKEDR